MTLVPLSSNVSCLSKSMFLLPNVVLPIESDINESSAIIFFISFLASLSTFAVLSFSGCGVKDPSGVKVTLLLNKPFKIFLTTISYLPFAIA